MHTRDPQRAGQQLDRLRQQWLALPPRGYRVTFALLHSDHLTREAETRRALRDELIALSDGRFGGHLTCQQVGRVYMAHRL